MSSSWSRTWKIITWWPRPFGTGQKVHPHIIFIHTRVLDVNVNVVIIIIIVDTIIFNSLCDILIKGFTKFHGYMNYEEANKCVSFYALHTTACSQYIYMHIYIYFTYIYILHQVLYSCIYLCVDYMDNC